MPLHRILNARLDDGRVVDIEVTGGHITAITPSGFRTPESRTPESRTSGIATSDTDVESFDAQRFLLLSSFAEPHAHLDKAFLSERIDNPTGDLMGAITAVAEQAQTLTFDDIVLRATRAAQIYVANGATRIRSHVDTTNGSTLHVRALRHVAQDLSHLCDIQVCALVEWPITGAEGAANRRLAEQARLDGADLIGGCPHLDVDPHGANTVFLNLARDLDCGLDLHVDETLATDMLSLADLADQYLSSPIDQPVTASHCVSLGMQDADTQRRVAKLVSRADISVVALPQTNLYLQGRDHTAAIPRGLTALHTLRKEGVRVVAGADNIQDPFNPMSRVDPMETASLMVTAGHFSVAEALRAVSADAHAVLTGSARGSSHGVNVGSPADFVLSPAATPRELMAFGSQPRVTIYRGRVVSDTR
jgi:cytosine deaminase